MIITLEFMISEIKRFYKEYNYVPTVLDFKRYKGYPNSSWVRENGYKWNEVLQMAGFTPRTNTDIEIIEHIEKLLIDNGYTVINTVKDNFNAKYQLLVNNTITVGIRYSSVMSKDYNPAYKFKNRSKCDYLICYGEYGDIFVISNKDIPQVISINPHNIEKSKYRKCLLKNDKITFNKGDE